MSTGGEIWFYHMERSSLEDVLPELLQRTLARGWRALVRVNDGQTMSSLDERLWTWRADSFLPHGRADGERPARQPILLTDRPDNENAAQVLFLVDGADLDPQADYERQLVLFDGRDDVAVARARAQWKQVKSAGAEASYWKQNEEGAWSRAA